MMTGFDIWKELPGLLFHPLGEACAHVQSPKPCSGMETTPIAEAINQQQLRMMIVVS